MRGLVPLTILSLGCITTSSSDDDDDGGGGGLFGGSDSGSMADGGDWGGTDSGGDSDGGGSDGGGSDGGGGGDSGSGDGGSGADGLGDATDCSLEGRTFEMDLENASWVEPAGVGSLLASYIENDLRITIYDQTSSKIQGRLAFFDGSAQDHCQATVEFPRADFSDPSFSVGPTDTTITMSGMDVDLLDLNMSGMFASDCSWVGRGRVTGQVDTRGLVDLVDEGGSEDSICELVTGFGLSCENCSSDGKPYCLATDIQDITGEKVSGEVDCVALDECHPECSSSDCSDPSDGVCE